jgi:hypothetical protein
MSPSQIISKAIAGMPECLAAGFVDLRSGLLLDIKTAGQHPSGVMDLLAAATADLFQGPNALAIESVFNPERGEEGNNHYFQEILVTSENLLHVFLRGKQHQDYVAVFVCRNTTNLGMVLAKARLALPAFEASL